MAPGPHVSAATLEVIWTAPWFRQRTRRQYREKDLIIDGALTLCSFNVRTETMFGSESSRSSDRDELFSKSS